MLVVVHCCFCDVGCCSSFIAVFVMLLFIHCFSMSSLTLPWAIAGFLHPFYTFSSAHRSVIHGTFNFSGQFIFTPSATVFTGPFLPQSFFTLRFFACNSDTGRNIPFRVFLCAYPHRVVAWCVAFNYWCSNYKTICLPIAPVSHEV